jgi:alpha-ribazole phosphatase
MPDGPPFAIVHSPLGRARRSAELAVEEMTAAGCTTPPLRPDAGFCEIAQGSWEGLTDAEITARFGDSLSGWRRWPTRFHAPGGEDLDGVEARVQSALAHLLAEMAEDSQRGTHDRNQVLGYGDGAPDRRRWSLVVGHGGVFRVVMCVLLGLSVEHFWNFDFGLGAITVVEIRAGRAVLRTLNYESHLDDDSQRGSKESAERNASGAL